MKRTYIDPPASERCEHRARVGTKGETAQCGRRKKIGGYCQQHHDLAERRVEAFRRWRAEQVRQGQ